MKFNDDNYPPQPKQGSHSSEISDSVADAPQHMIAVAGQRIMEMHHHEDGSSVELHEIGSKEFIQQSIQSSLEGKLAGGNGFDDVQLPQQNNASINNLASAKIEYEKKSSQNQPQHDLFGKGQSKTELYGTQQSVTGVSHRQETIMMGCNCGAEWTVTGQSTKTDPSKTGVPGEIKIEQYGSSAGQAPGYKVSGGGGPGEYRAGGEQQQGYKG